MRIQFDSSTGRAKVIDHTLESKEVYLDGMVLQDLESKGKLNSFEQMNFLINLNIRRWEISDPIPFGTPGTLASVIFAIGGNVYEEQNSSVICTLG